MIAFAALIVIAHDALAVDDQRQTIFEMVVAAGHGYRHMSQNRFEKRRIADGDSGFFDQHGFNVVFNNITHRCCQEQQRWAVLHSKAALGFDAPTQAPGAP